MKLTFHDRARARLAAERGGRPHRPEAAVRFVLAFPNLYAIGMASLGFHLVYGVLNNPPRSSCERAFLPSEDEISEHRRTGAPLFALESLRPLHEFDVIAFSVSYEMDYLNVLRMLDLAGLPPARRDRDESHPLVVAGGVCATFNPEPMADFFDAFVIGEAEAVLPDTVRVIESGLRMPRSALLAALSEVAGVYVPALYEPRYDARGRLVEVAASGPTPARVRRAVAGDLSGLPASSELRAETAAFGDTTLVEVSRGCGRQCRFCVSGYVTRPPRHRRAEDMVGEGRLGLVGAAVFDHPEAEAICRSIVDAGNEFTVSSVRLESVTPELARLMAAGGQKTLTIAPEAGTRRLRRVINKDCSDEDVAAAVAAASDAGIRRVKLYFMIGLPTETDTDVEATVEMVRRLAREFSSVRFQVSVSVFVPKPWTPFQWSPMERPDVLKNRYRALRRALTGTRGVAFSGESPRLAAFQALLARGDRRTGCVLVAAHANGGRYAAAAKECGIDMEEWLTREREQDEVFPWDHIDVRVDKAYLWREYKRAAEGATTGPCRPRECRACGAC